MSGDEHRHNDEIDLFELLETLWRRKTLILGGTVLLSLLAAGIALLLPPVYEITAIIEPGKRPISDKNGQIIEERVVDSAVAIREAILGGAYNERIRNDLAIAESDFPDIEVSVPKNTDFVKIAVQTSDPQHAVDIVSKIVSLVSAGMAEKIDRERQRIQNELRLAEIDVKTSSVRLDLLQNQIAATEKIIDDLQKEKQSAFTRNRNDAMAVLLYGNEVQNQQIYLNNLQSDLNETAAEEQKAQAKLENQRKMLEAVQAMTVYKTPLIPETPIRPQKTLIVALTFCASIFAFSLLAFLLEAIHVRKSRTPHLAETEPTKSPEEHPSRVYKSLSVIRDP